MVLAVDLGAQPTQTITSATPGNSEVALTLGSNGTLIFDGVTSQIDTVVGIAGVANTTIESIHGANVTINSSLLSVSAGSTFTYDIGAGSQLNFVQPTIGLGLGASTTINFQGTGGTGVFTFTPSLLNLNVGPLPTITGLSTGDKIDVIGATAASLNGGVLTFTYPGALGIPTAVQFTLTGIPTGASVTFDAATGTAVFACFLRGTRVATPGGEVAVEDLRAGDEVITLNRGKATIKWMGRRTLDPKAIHPPSAGLPVRVRQHAIAENVPHRDLVLSPDHSLFFDGALIPVKLLINGTTIAQETPEGPFEYYHVELDQHDVIMVEGALAETYVDMGNRHMFVEPGVVQLFFDARRGDWSDYCYPPLYDGPVFDRIFARLEEQAERLGYVVRPALAS